MPESLENGLRYRSGRKLRSCVKSNGGLEAEEKKEQEKRKKKGRETSQNCQLCEFQCKTVKAMSEHCHLQHPGQTLHCPFPACQIQRTNYMKLRTHQHATKHFITKDLSNHKNENDQGEKSFQLNNNERKENVNESGGSGSEDELDLRLELDEEEELALHDEDKN